MVPRLTQLKTLYIYSNPDQFEEELQTLLPQQLHHSVQPMSILEYPNIFIHRLDLDSCYYYCNEEECLLASRLSVCQ